MELHIIAQKLLMKSPRVFGVEADAGAAYICGAVAYKRFAGRYALDRLDIAVVAGHKDDPLLRSGAFVDRIGGGTLESDARCLRVTDDLQSQDRSLHVADRKAGVMNAVDHGSFFPSPALRRPEQGFSSLTYRPCRGSL